MDKRVLTVLMTLAILFTLITPGLVPRVEAAGSIVTKSYTATMDTMELNGHIQDDGIHDNDGDGFLTIGRSNDEFGNVWKRAGITFDLGASEGTIVSAELVLTVANTIRKPDHTLFMEVRGSAVNELNYTSFPSWNVNSPYADKFTAKSIAEVPMATYLQNQSITLNVKSVVDAFTDISDRKITFMLNGNEADADSGWFSIHSLETYGNVEYRPKLVVTYVTGPDNTAPTGSFTITEGAMTNKNVVNLSITGSDPDAGDSVTHMRFADSAANLSAASWLPFSNTATFSLSGGDGAKNIYMQLRDFNNGISSNSSQTILLDQTAPTGTLIMNDGATWANSNRVTLKGTYTDRSGSGVEEARLSNSSGSWQTSWFKIADLNGKSWTLPAGDGAKTVYVQYKDVAGNMSSSISSVITVDTVKPIITNVEHGKVYNGIVSPQFNEGSGLLNGNPYSSGTNITQNGAYTLIVTDSAGNSATVSFQIDTSSPIVLGVANGGIYNTSKVITFDEGTATLNGAAFVSGTEVSLDGAYTLIVTDTAGNITSVSFIIDKVAPIVVGVSNNGSYKEPVNITFDEGTATLNGAAFVSGTDVDQEGRYTLVVTDAAGNVTTVNFEIDRAGPTVTGVAEGEVYQSATPEFNEGTATLNGAAYITGTEIDQTGSYTLVVTDEAGNVTTISFQIDATAPTGTVVVQADAEWSNVSEVTLTLTSDDGNDGSGVAEMRISNDGNGWNSWEPLANTKNWNLASGDGEKAVYVQFKDKVGNVSETIQDVIKLDQTIPTGTIIINGGATTATNKQVTLTLTSADGTGSGVTEMRFSLDNVTWLDWENVLPSAQWSFTGNSGLQKLYVQFRDAAGNVSIANMASITFQESYPAYEGSNSGSTDNTEVVPSDEVLISIGSESENTAKVDVKTVEGKKVTTIFLEDDQLEGMLNESGNRPVITITVRSHSDVINWEMNAELLQRLVSKNAIIQVNTENVAYTLPLDQVSVNKWGNQLGTNISLVDMKIKMEIITHPLSAFEHLVSSQVSLVVPPVSIAIKGVYGNKEIELNQTDTFMERRLVIPAEIDPARVTTGVKLMSDGMITHIPTKIVHEAGRNYAIVHSNTNNIYGLIYNKKTFDDVARHWAQKSINDLASRLVINGADEQRFLPDSEITRAEFTAIMSRALGLSSANKTASFNDVGEKAWYHQAVQIGYSYGLVDGYSDGSFQPNEKITRQEAMIILSKAMKLVGLNKEIDDAKQQELMNHFVDSEQLASWAQQAAALTIEIGIIGGYHGELHPQQNITRAETAEIIQRLLQKADFIN
ncbi:S-layer homology domain-containing protein [Paenibacillus yanchengensis]|uniref:S-layer homology domain-containing protein n=1 Tax=Paenibacillus yanchengensis TaxID=2035833 RepID=A0ABW4YHK3_9BACL